jgi:hypothetical protein
VRCGQPADMRAPDAAQVLRVSHSANILDDKLDRSKPSMCALRREGAACSSAARRPSMRSAIRSAHEDPRRDPHVSTKSVVAEAVRARFYDA